MCAGKSKHSFDQLYCDIRFIVVAWTQSHNISEVCLQYFYNLMLESLKNEKQEAEEAPKGTI